MSIEIIIGFYCLLFYFVALAPKGTFATWFIVMGYFMSAMLLLGAPPFGVVGFIFVWLCQRRRKRKDEGKPFFNFKFWKRKKKMTQTDYALRQYVDMLSTVSWNEYQEVKNELSDKNQILKHQEEQIRKLLEEKEYLKKKQAKENKITEVTPRLRHYREQAKKYVENEEIELEKLKRKRLEEEIRRLKNLDN